MDTLQEVKPRTQRELAQRAGWAPSLGVATLAVVVAVGVRLVAQVFGIDVRVDSAGTPADVGLGAVAIASGVAALAGVLVLQLALPHLARGRRWWTVCAAAVLAVSLLGPLQAASVSSGLVLTVLHLATGAVVVLGLRRVSA